MCGGGLEPTVCLISALNHHWYNNNIAIGVEPMYAGRSLPNTMYRTPHTDYHVPDIYFGNIRLSMQSQIEIGGVEPPLIPTPDRPRFHC